MSHQYPGLPTAAKSYTLGYIRVLLGMGVFLAFTGAFGALLVSFLSPEMIIFYIIAFISVGLHLAAVYIRDVWMEEYEPGQAEFASVSQFLAVFTLLGSSYSGTLLLGTIVGASAVSLGLPFVVAATAAAYYPVLDILLFRNGYWTPGGILTYISAWFIMITMNVPTTIVDSFPVIWKRQKKRPQA